MTDTTTEQATAVRRRIAVLTADALAPSMAGPAIRAWHIAEALSAEHEVRLATTGPCSLTDERFSIAHIDAEGVNAIEAWADVIIFQGFLMYEFPVLDLSSKIVVVDIYDPVHLEQLEQARDLGEQKRREVVHASSAVFNQQIRRGDFFMCASEKQRDFWLGALGAMDRINPQNYDADPQLRELIDVVPFGTEDSEPEATRPMVRGVIDGIDENSKVVLWGGGIYNWFDPLTLIRAIDIARHRVPEIKLLFMGVKHPNPAVPEMQMAVEARALAQELDLVGAHVVFHEEWVPYAERVNFLLESDIGVSCHLDHVETAFSFRTRILDYLWSGLPIVCTGGDSFAGLVENEGLGRTVPAQDPQALADALVEVLTDAAAAKTMRDNVLRVRERYRWSVVLRPLLDFCRVPHHAPDRSDPLVLPAPAQRRGLLTDVGLARQYLRQGGPRLVARKAASRTAKALPRPVKRAVTLVLFGRNGRPQA